MDGKSARLSNLELKKLIIPLVIEQTLSVLVGLIDVLMVSSVGEAAVSGVSLADMINILLINIFAALATGGAVVISQAIGRKEIAKGRIDASMLLTISLITGLIIMLLSLLLGEQILNLLYGKVETSVMEAAVKYFKITAISFPFLAIYNSSAAIFRSMGNSKISMFTSTIMNIINVCGNAILIFGFKMDVAGVAIPTVVSRVVAAILITYLLLNKNLLIYINLKDCFKIKGKTIKNILVYGIPSAIENSLFQLGRILVVALIALYPTYQTSANSVANTFDSLGCIPGSAMNLAMIAVIGQLIGAKDYEGARIYTKKLLKWTYIYTIGLNLVICATIPFAVNLYNISPEAKTLTIYLVLIHDGFAMLLWPTAFTLPNALRASNYVNFTMIVSTASMFIFRIGLSYLFHFTLGLGALGVWIAMVFDWLFKAIIFLIFFKISKLEPRSRKLKLQETSEVK